MKFVTVILWCLIALIFDLLSLHIKGIDLTTLASFEGYQLLAVVVVLMILKKCILERNKALKDNFSTPEIFKPILFISFFFLSFLSAVIGAIPTQEDLGAMASTSIYAIVAFLFLYATMILNASTQPLLVETKTQI